MLTIHRIIYKILYPIFEIVCKIEATAQTQWECFGMLYDSSYLAPTEASSSHDTALKNQSLTLFTLKNEYKENVWM